ncbi:DUF3426 domain-containing protein [Fundidesulfovibrio soli]|uniref:DUF3426 domain-containing protein n=1 Tax=Fundidesulfovibrio soli TaxID=2922716 RepID=UPI001FAF7556|nr:DUF3426 domain-containing protein [Fundidesulfovibrio soli]
MKVECPNCQTTYNLPDERVGQDGATVRCTVCKHKFHVDAPTPEDFPGFGDTGASPVWPVQGEDEPDVSNDFASHLDAQRKKDPYVDAGLPGEDFTSADFATIEFGKQEKPASEGLSRKSLILAILLGVVVLGGAGATAAYFMEFWPFAKKTPASAMEGAPQAADQSKQPKKEPAQQPQAPSHVASLVIESNQYYFTENEKIGKLFVIEGKIVNRSPVVVGQVKIDATLLDPADAPVLSKSITAGPKASNFELKTMQQADMEARLNSVQEILLNNGSVKPGEEIPFMFVFPNPPANLGSFSLTVTDYQELAPQAGQQPSDKK